MVLSAGGGVAREIGGNNKIPIDAANCASEDLLLSFQFQLLPLINRVTKRDVSYRR